MAITLGVTDSYATETEADAYLINNTIWNTATSADKTTALLFARYYIDENFSCALDNETVIPDALKYATSLLAADYIEDSTVFDSGASIKEKEVQADVSSRTVYSTPLTNKPKSLQIVKGILKDLCVQSSSTVYLVRT